MPLTRRRLIATSGAGLAAGGAATVLAACGGNGREERTADRDVRLLQQALDAQARLSETYGVAAEQQLGNRVTAAVEAFAEQAGADLELLREAIDEAGGTPEEVPAEPPAAESAVEAVRIALDDAIAAGHEVVGQLSAADAREAVYRVMISDAGQLAVIRGILGEDRVPVAFVTGGAAAPLSIDPEEGG